jgi:hypothetical protein
MRNLSCCSASAIDERDLIAQIDAAVPLARSAPSSGELLETDDLSVLFGLELAGVDIVSATSVAEVGVAATKSTRKNRPAAVPKKIGKRRRKTAA